MYLHTWLLLFLNIYIYIYDDIYIYIYIMIYIYTLCKPSVWFSKLRTPKKGICVQSHSTVMSCSSMEWSGDSMGDNQHMMVGESWILCFFCGSLPSSMVSSLPTFLHLYGLYIHSCCQLKPQVVITLSRWKFDFCPQLLITVFWLQFDRRSFSLPPKVWPFTSYKCL